MAEGERNVCDSLKFGKADKLFVKEGVSIPENADCSVYRVSENVMKELSDTVTPQGMIGVFEIPKFKSECVCEKILVLNGVSDPGNVGTLLRTALAMGFLTVICDEKTADVYSPKVVRSAMSAVFSLNILRTDSLSGTLGELKKDGYTVCTGILSDKSENIGNISFPKKNIIVLGNEANGVEREIAEMSDILYIIPMNNAIESLNVAVSGGIVMYCANK